MITGISRYKKGKFNQSVLDEVYDLAKVKYVDPTPPPSSGIIRNSVNLIWEDMTTPANVSPPCTAAQFAKGPAWKKGDITPPSKGGTGIIRNPNDPSDGYNPGPPAIITRCNEWRKCNVWYEVEEDAGQPVKWCAPTINKAVNSQVELGGLTGAWLDYNGVWHVLYDNYKNISGGRWPKEKMNYPPTRGCTVEAYQVYEDIRQQYPDYDPIRGYTDNGHVLIRPAHYWRVHMWGTGSITVPELMDGTGGRHAPPGQMKAYYSCSWARLVLVDPDGVDDRHLARYIWHVSADAKQSNGKSACLSDIGGHSKYKLVPQNGDWEAANMVVGDITEAEFRNNPPPFPTKPF